MNKKIIILFLWTVSHITILFAQHERPLFRKGSQHIGINMLGNKLNNNLSPKDNVFKGNFGASTGFVFECGHIYYFKPVKDQKTKFNYGIDWTISSMTYNKLNGWKTYGNSSGAEMVVLDGSLISAAVSTKLGPIISFNPVESLIINLHFQVAPTARVTNFEYYENEDKPDKRSFSFFNYGEEATDPGFDASSFKNIIAFGLGSNFGISVRRKAFGFAFDYNLVNANTNYDAYEGEDNHSFGKQKIKTNFVQLKLSLSL